jgi:hypothetical protein
MELGLALFREPGWLHLHKMLMQPWVGPVGPLRGSVPATPQPPRSLGSKQ